MAEHSSGFFCASLQFLLCQLLEQTQCKAYPRSPHSQMTYFKQQGIMLQSQLTKPTMFHQTVTFHRFTFTALILCYY